MNRPQRDKVRIDYKVLSDTGDKISKEANLCTTENQTRPRILQTSNLLTNFSMTEEQKFGHMDQVSVDELTLIAFIRDAIDENSGDEIISINEIESVLMKIEQLLSEIKAYIKELKYKKHSINDVKISAERNEIHTKQKSLKLLISETKRSIHE